MPLSAAQPGFPGLLIAPCTPPRALPVRDLCGRCCGFCCAVHPAGIADVRLEVFVIEQGVPFSLEIDARDDLATTIHVLARGADDAPLAAGRLLIDPVRPGVVHLGRLAVRRACRGTGLGARMVSALEDAAWRAAAARDDGAAVTVILSAQEQAMGFYERCGYTAVTGESYLDAGIPHQDMARVVSR